MARSGGAREGVDEVENCTEFHTNFLDPISLEMRKDTINLIHELSKPGANAENAGNRCQDLIQQIEKELGAEDIVCELVCKEMAECLRKMRLVDDAVELIRSRMQRINREDFGCLLTLGHIYEISGDYQKAEEPRKNALRLAKDGGDPVLVSLSLVKLACNSWHRQDSQVAKDLVAQCLEKLRDCDVQPGQNPYPFGAQTYRLIDTYKTLAYMHRFLGDRSESAEFYTKALEITRQDRDAIVHHFKLETQVACEYSCSGSYKHRAKEYCLMAHKGIKEIQTNEAFMVQHALTVIHALSRVAHSLEQAVGDSSHVLEIREELYDIAKKYLSHDHPEVARTAADAAFMCSKLSNSSKEDLYVQRAEAALETCCSSPTLEFLKLYSREISDAWKSLGLTYSNRTNFEQTEHCFEQALTVNTRVYGKCHPRVGRLCRSFGFLYKKCNKFSLAIKYFTKCKEINDEYSPDDSELRKKLKKDIAITKNLQKKYGDSY